MQQFPKMLLTHQLRGSVKEEGSRHLILYQPSIHTPAEPSRGVMSKPPWPQDPDAVGCLGHSTRWLFPGVGSSCGFGTQMCLLGMRPQPALEGTRPHPRGIPLASGSGLWHTGGPERDTTRDTQWHLCDPEGPWWGWKALTKNNQFLRAWWFGFFPLHLLTQEGRARCWQSVCSHIYPRQSCLGACFF